jgi:hypothetical protein
MITLNVFHQNVHYHIELGTNPCFEELLARGRGKNAIDMSEVIYGPEPLIRFGEVSRQRSGFRRGRSDAQAVCTTARSWAPRATKVRRRRLSPGRPERATNLALTVNRYRIELRIFERRRLLRRTATTV